VGEIQSNNKDKVVRERIAQRSRCFGNGEKGDAEGSILVKGGWVRRSLL